MGMRPSRKRTPNKAMHDGGNQVFAQPEVYLQFTQSTLESCRPFRERCGAWMFGAWMVLIRLLVTRNY